MRVLIASEDESLVPLVRGVLAEGAAPAVERIGREAEVIDRQRSGPATLLLLDVRGAPMAARLERVGALRAAGHEAPLTVVLLIGLDDPPPRPLLEEDADDFVILPCDPRALAARLHVALRAAAGAVAVKTLARNEARFRSLVQHSGDITAVFSADGRVLYASPTVERVTGRAVGSLLGTTAFDYCHPEDLAALREHYASGGLGPRPLRLRHVDGSDVHLDVMLSDLLDDPNVRGVVVNARDVTERERAISALRRSEEYLSATLRAIGEAVLSTDAAGRVVRMNPVAERLTGWTLDEARGQPLAEVAPIREPEVGAVPFTERALDGGPLSGRSLSLSRRDGLARPVSATATPIHDGEGRAAGVVLVLRDITDEQRSAEALRRSEHSFRSLIERAPEGITVQRRGRIIYANPAAVAMLGHPDAESLVGRAGIDLVHPDDREVVRALDEEAVRSGDPSPAREQRYLRADGAQVVAETIALPVEFDGAAALVHIARDVTGRRQLESRLLVTDRMVSVGTLAAGVAHEINNPLAGVVANLRFLQEELDELGHHLPAERRKEITDSLRDGQEAAERVRVIVRDLKAFSRGDEERRGPVDVVQVVESTVHLAWNEIRHRARLVRDLHPVPAVMANEARLGQVLLNLLINAAHSIVEGDAERNVIRVTTREGERGRVVVEVTDSGVGIPEEHRRRLFDPFFTTKPVGVGTGLGLFVCQGIITSLGGEIAIESEVGRGTTARVLLPGIPKVAAPSPAAAVKANPAQRGRVLVVDDEPMILVSVRRLLAAEHEVVTVSSAQEALRLIRQEPRFDVVLCDLMMPDMTGMDLHAALKAEQPELAAAVIFLTGGAFTLRARAFLDEVDNERLEKPFEAKALRAAVRKQLQHKPG